MSLIDRFLDKSPAVRQIVGAIGALALQVEKLGSGVAALAQIAQTHQQALQDLYARQGLVMKAVSSSGPDLRMPDGKKPETKPN